MPNLSLAQMKDLSSFRKIALGTWRTAYDPSIYGTLVLRMDRALDYIARFRARTGRRLTVSHLMAKASAMALPGLPGSERHPPLEPHLPPATDRGLLPGAHDRRRGKADLSGATLYDLERKSLLEIVDEFEQKVGLVRAARRTQRWRRPAGRSSGSRTSSSGRSSGCSPSSATPLNLDLRWLGIASDPFGSLMITNIGSLGLDTAYAPLVPFSRVPLLFAIGEATGRGAGGERAARGGQDHGGERDHGPPGHRRLPCGPDRRRPPELDGEPRLALRRSGARPRPGGVRAPHPSTTRARVRATASAEPTSPGAAGLRRDQGEAKADGRALPRLAPDDCRPAMRLDDALDNRETQAGPLRRLSAPVRLEDPIELRRSRCPAHRPRWSNETQPPVTEARTVMFPSAGANFTALPSRLERT